MGRRREGWDDWKFKKDWKALGALGLGLGPQRPHRKNRSSSACSLFPKAPPASRIDPASERSDCGETGTSVNAAQRTVRSALTDGAADTAAGVPGRSRSLGLPGP